MEIEEGDLVVTPEYEGCWIGEVEAVKSNFKENDTVIVDGVSFQANNCVKLNAPIRVRVDEPEEAECLVALAEGNGFDVDRKHLIEYPPQFNLFFSPEGWVDSDGLSRKYLTFESDYQQIKRWLTHHGESEDECETCGGRGEHFPHCTDDSKSVDEVVSEELEANKQRPNVGDDSSDPRPENEEYYEVSDYSRDEFLNILCHVLVHNAPEIPVGDGQEVPIVTAINELKRLYLKVDDLESELENCWENQQEYKNDVAELQLQLHNLRVRERGHRLKVEDLQEELEDVREERDGLQIQLENYAESNKKFRELNGDLRERIEEAREALQWIDDPELNIINEAIEILTPDSDEGYLPNED